MNKHTRLIVSLLFIGFIVLAVAITRFYSRTEKSAASSNSQNVIVNRLNFDSYGNRAFQNSDGLVGIIDGSDRVIVSPEWRDIRFTGGDMCVASKRIRGKEFFGCIDYEGNITVPFVYSKIERVSDANQVLYLACTADDKSWVVYDKDFTPCFSKSWEDCKYIGGDLILTADSGTYTYSVTSSELIFKKALINGSSMEIPYSISVSSRVLLSKLTVPMLEKINSTVNRYIEYAYTGSSDLLRDIDKETSAVFLPLFPEEHNITNKKLTELSDISVYSIRSEDGLPHFAVSVTADTFLTYRNSEDKPKRLQEKYKALIEFTGSSADELKAVSGRFTEDKPNYPAPEPEAQPER